MKEKIRQNKSILMIAHFLVVLLVISLIPLATLHVSADDNLPENEPDPQEFEELQPLMSRLPEGQADQQSILSLTRDEGSSTEDDSGEGESDAGVSPLGIPDGGFEGPVCEKKANLFIRIRKEVRNSSTSDDFHFQIYLEENVPDTESPYPCRWHLVKAEGERTYWKNANSTVNLTFVNGLADFTLKRGERIEIQAKPGSMYEIKEITDENSEFTVSVNGLEKGTLEAHVEVVFTNTYPDTGEEQEEDKGSLKIEKITEGPFELGRIFVFSVLPTAAGGLEQADQAEQNILRQAGSSDPGNERMTLTSSINTDDERQLAAGNRINIGGTATSKEHLVELKAGKSATIDDLPVGRYLVKEMDAEDCDVYSYSEGSGLVAMSTKGVKWFPGSSRIVEVVKDQTTTVTFKNVKVAPGFVTVKKTLTGEGADPKEKFDFILTWSIEASSTSIIERIKDEDMVPEEGSLGLSRENLPSSNTQGDRINTAQLDQGAGAGNQTIIGKEPSEPLSGKKEFSLGDGEQVTFDDIPLGASFTVIEVDSSNLVGVKVNGQEAKTATGKVKSGETLAIEFENKRAPAAADSPGELVAGDEDIIIPATGVNTVTLFMGLVMMTMGMIAMVFGSRVLKRKED